MNRARTPAVWLLGGLLVLISGCGGSGDSSPADAPITQTNPNEQQSASVDPSTFGEITVTVEYSGEVPEGKEIYTGANPECRVETVVKRDVRVNDNRRLRDAVVAIQDGPPGFASRSDVPGQPVLDQENCRYTPHVLVAETGRTITVKNGDPGMHNVRASREGSQVFNKTTLRDQSFEQTFDRAGVYNVQCDVHRWMSGWIYVTPHGKAAVTDRQGTATLSSLPPGDYTLRVWHETLGDKTTQLHLDEQGSKSVTVTFTS